MRKPNCTEKQVREALAHAGGIPAKAARYLTQTYGRPCARNTISTYLAKSADLRSFQAECLETALDEAESALVHLIKQGNINAIRFLLETKGKHRGYTRRIEATVPRGGPIGREQEENARELVERKIEAVRARLRQHDLDHPEDGEEKVAAA